MQKHLTLVVLCLMLLVTAIAAAPPKQNDEDQIKSLLQQWKKSFEAKDLDGVMKVYVSGDELVAFDVVPPLKYVGQEAYRKDYAELFAGFEGPLAVELNDLSITADRNMAYSRVVDHVTGKGKDGHQMDLTVRVTDVYRKTGGKWLIVHEHVSAPVDLATGKADLQAK
jgi:uncharacterized protein (TIGR02246 family)